MRTVAVSRRAVQKSLRDFCNEELHEELRKLFGAVYVHWDQRVRGGGYVELDCAKARRLLERGRTVALYRPRGSTYRDYREKVEVVLGGGERRR